MGTAPPLRRHRRLTVRLTVELRGDFGVRRALATTLGAGGLFVATPAPLPPESALRVRLRLAGETAARQLAARVVWTLPPERAGHGRSPGMGLAFVDAAEVAGLARALERSAHLASAAEEAGS